MTHALLHLPNQVLFGTGAADAAAASIRGLGERVFVVTDSTLAESAGLQRLLDQLEHEGAAPRMFADTAADVPVECVEMALHEAYKGPIDVVVGFGGGSCIDLAKLTSLLLRHPGPLSLYYGENAVPGPILPVVAIPTTAGTGSEVTPVAVVSDSQRRLKVGVSSPELVCRLAVCDPLLTLSCPSKVTAYAGVDALVHALEALTAGKRDVAWSARPWPVFRGKNPMSDMFAIEAIGRISRALEMAVANGQDAQAREDMLFGSLCAGVAFAHAGTAGAHALQYPVGAETGTPHGLGVGLLAPYVLEYVRRAAHPDLERAAQAMGVSDPIAELERLSRHVGVPHTLQEIGIGRDLLGPMSREAAGITRLTRNSPRPLEPRDLLTILEAAWDGDRLRLSGDD